MGLNISKYTEAENLQLQINKMTKRINGMNRRLIDTEKDVAMILNNNDIKIKYDSQSSSDSSSEYIPAVMY